MKKDAYYFSHDSNAQDDPKCMQLIDDLGMEGYGIFWALIEKLRAEKNFMLPHAVAKPFAKRWGTTEDVVKRVIKDYHLFSIEGENFYSERLKNSMEIKSEKARESANYRWKNAVPMRANSERNATGMRKDAIKGKKSKVKERKKSDFIFGEGNTGLPPGMVM